MQTWISLRPFPELTIRDMIFYSKKCLFFVFLRLNINIVQASAIVVFYLNVKDRFNFSRNQFIYLFILISVLASFKNI